MTVIVLYKDDSDGKYKITGDGRTSQDWMGVFSDNTTKVFNEGTHIFGSAGDASSKTVIPVILKKSKGKHINLLRLCRDKDFVDILPNCQTIFAHHKEGIGMLSIHGSILGGKQVQVLPLQDEQLPQAIGSGFINVRTLLSGKVTTQKTVEKAIKDSYEVNHTIGGKITTVVLDYKPTRKRKPPTKTTTTTKKRK